MIVEPTRRRLRVIRNGSSITRTVPKPVVIVDTREKEGYTFGAHSNWIAGIRRAKVDVGDYTVEGMEDLLALERKTLTDLLTTLTRQRPRFFRHCARLARLKRHVRRYREKVAGLRVESLTELAQLPFTTPEEMAESFPYGLFSCPMRSSG